MMADYTCAVFALVAALVLPRCMSFQVGTVRTLLYSKYFEGYYLPVNNSVIFKMRNTSRNRCAIACSKPPCVAFAFNVDERECTLLPDFVQGNAGKGSDALWEYFTRTQASPYIAETEQSSKSEDTTPQITTPVPSCPAGYTTYVPDNTCFKVVNNPTQIRVAAIAECGKDSGNLLVLNSMDELKKIDPYLKAGNLNKYYIGCEKKSSMWVTWRGDPVPFAMWASDQPNNVAQNYLVLYSAVSGATGNFEMHDSYGDETTGYICETDPQ